MAEARSSSDLHIESSHRNQDELQTDFKREWRRSFVKRFFVARNKLYNGLWPSSFWNLVAVILVLYALILNGSAPELWRLAHLFYLPNAIPRTVQAFIISCPVGLFFMICILYVRRYMLRILLSYRKWMYEPLHSTTWKTMLWGLTIKLVSGYHPSTYSYQQSLPRLPVPPLKQTLKQLVHSLKPLYGDSDEFQKLKDSSKEFERKMGKTLQNILHIRSWWSENWVTSWWEKYVYLMGRSPLPINSNYYIHDQSYCIPSPVQISRAANVVYQHMLFKRLIDREELTPLTVRNTVPLCMAQYERIFSTTRIPHKESDELLHYESSVSKHIAVQRRGAWFKVPMYDSKGYLLLPHTIEELLHRITEEVDSHIEDQSNEEDLLVPALTGLDRTDWADTRSLHFSSGLNKESLSIIESAILVLHLEVCSFSREDFSARCKYLLHGSGSNIWFDKSINLVVFSDGKYGMHCEHTLGDAPIMGHVVEYTVTKEGIEKLYDEDGHCLVKSKQPGSSSKPLRLLWNINRDLQLKIQRAVTFNQQNNADVDLCVKLHDDFGKGFIKTCKVSPDAFIQMALQLTYFKDAGKFALTYEASMTRLYRLGRTETVRSLSVESAEFVKAMLDRGRTDLERIQLLQKACDRHQLMYKDAMNGQGCDRHLFGLYVVSRWLGKECDFLTNVLTLPWTLSTSQQPQQQMKESPPCDLPQYRHMASPGGGFGPVSDQGYGVSYMVTGDFAVWFHVSSKVSAERTSSTHFMELLFESMSQIKHLFDK